MTFNSSVWWQNVPPVVLVRFLREHRSEWADFNVDAYVASSMKSCSYAYPGMRPTRFTGSQIIMPLGHTIEHEEVSTLHLPQFHPSHVLECAYTAPVFFIIRKLALFELLGLLPNIANIIL